MAGEAGKAAWSNAIDIAAKVTTVGATVVGGLWAAYIFVKFDKDHDIAQTNLVKAQTAQIGLADSQTVALQRLKSDEENMTSEQQRINLGIAKATAQFDIQAKSLQNSKAILDQEISEDDLRLRRLVQIHTTVALTVTCDNQPAGESATTTNGTAPDTRSSYSAHLHYVVENVSNKDVIVHWDAERLYLSHPKFVPIDHAPGEESRSLERRLDSGELAFVDYPEHFWGDKFDGEQSIDNEGSLIDWIPMGTRVEAINSADLNRDLRLAHFVDITPGGATGLLHKGDQITNETDMHVAAKPQQLLSAVIRIGLSGALKGSNIYKRSEMIRLPVCSGAADSPPEKAGG